MRVSVRGALLSAVAIVVTLGLVGSSVAGEKCAWKVTTLGKPTTTAKGWFANDISNNGLIGGGWIDEDGGFHAAYWWKGKAYDVATAIGLPAGGSTSNISSVNSAGLMGGNATGAVYGAALWNFKKETVQDIHPDDLEGAFYVASSVAGVNARGDAVGWAVSVPAPDDHPIGYEMLAYVWPKNDRDGYVLPGLDGYIYVQSTGINSRGEICGYGITETWEWHALMWKKSKRGNYELYDLQEEEFDGSDFIESEAYDVSETGEVVGRAWFDLAEPSNPYSWTRKDGIDGLDIDSETYGIAWKAAGKYVAGGIGVGTFLGQAAITDDAAVWVNGKLHVVVTEIGDHTNCEAASVNASGTVVGGAFTDYDPDDPSSGLPIGWVARRRCDHD